MKGIDQALQHAFSIIACPSVQAGVTHLYVPVIPEQKLFHPNY
jgi:hypothetical protein